MIDKSAKVIDHYAEPNFLCVNCGKGHQKLIRIFAETAMVLQSCVKCQKPVDKYIEYDFTPIFIDILLLKMSAYRHVLFNNNNKAFLPRLVALTILTSSYVEWVFEKHLADKGSLPVFYELEWGYYTVILNQAARVTVFAGTFLGFGFLVSLSKKSSTFSWPHALEGVAISYCWNLVRMPSLVWNHHMMYSILSEAAMFISSSHIFIVCIHPNYCYSLVCILFALGMQWSAGQALYSLLKT